MAFEDHIGHVLGVEGGYVNDLKDSGGETNWGVTRRVAQAHGYTGAMATMPRHEAVRIYRAVYWDALRLDDIEHYSRQVAAELFDSAVNCGPSRAGQWLQHVLNAMNQEQALYADIPEDGQVGAMTLAALHAYLKARPALLAVQVLLRALNALQGAHYLNLAATRKKDERFVFGWFANRVS